MTTQVNASACTETAPHRFVTEASEIGLRPGEWPMRLTTDLGNGGDLLRKPFLRSDGTAVYLQEFGCVSVHVLND